MGIRRLQSGEITDLRHLYQLRRNNVYEEPGEFERADGRIEKETETGPTDQLQPWEQKGQHMPGGEVWGLLRGASLLRNTASVRASGESTEVAVRWRT